MTAPEKTGWPAGLLQDDDRGLSRWFASRPDARQRVREAAALIQGNSSASKPGAHMPITLEGDEPEEPTSWELIGAGAQWALLALAFVCTLLAAAGAFLTN